jgi:hypothetical protein
MNLENENNSLKTVLETEILLDFAQLKLTRIIQPIKQELDKISLEEIDQLINVFKKTGFYPDEVQFLQNLAALKIANKNIETGHLFNQKVSPSPVTAVKQQPQ